MVLAIVYDDTIGILTSGRGLASKEHDLRVDLLALLRRHVLDREVPLQSSPSAPYPLHSIQQSALTWMTPKMFNV